jgi:hypothetical protein
MFTASSKTKTSTLISLVILLNLVVVITMLKRETGL